MSRNLAEVPFRRRALNMENKIFLLMFILIDAVILAFCETDSYNSFGPRLNEKLDSGNLDLSKRKDFYLFENKELSSEVKNVGKRPFNERYSQPGDVNSLEIPQDVSKTNFSEKQNEMAEYRQDGYNNWQREKTGPFYTNKQEIQEPLVGQTFNRRINPQANNEWDRSGSFFQNPQSRWNEEDNFRQYQTAKTSENYNGKAITVQNMRKPDIWKANVMTKSFVNDREMNDYFPLKNDVPEKKASITLLNDDEVKSTNSYDHELLQNRFKSHLNSNINYYNRNVDGFRNSNFPNPEKGVVINFNTECSTTKPFHNPVFHKFIFASKPRIPQAEVPTFQIPETTVITRQMSTPIYYL